MRCQINENFSPVHKATRFELFTMYTCCVHYQPMNKIIRNSSTYAANKNIRQFAKPVALCVPALYYVHNTSVYATNENIRQVAKPVALCVNAC